MMRPPSLHTVTLTFFLCSSPAIAQNETYMKLCAGCHGDNAGGTERGPALIDSRSLRSLSVTRIEEIIRTGTQGGMPAFRLPATQIRPLSRWIHSLNASAFDVKPEGDVVAGEQFYFAEGKCAGCHMVAGRGGTNGPDLSN